MMIKVYFHSDIIIVKCFFFYRGVTEIGSIGFVANLQMVEELSFSSTVGTKYAF